MQFSRTVVFATLSALVSSSAIPAKRGSTDQELYSSLMSSISAEFADPEVASYLMSSALGYISSDLPSGQKTIQQSDLQSVVSKYGPSAASQMLADIFSTVDAQISMANLAADELSSLKSALSYASKSGFGPMSSILVNALNSEATVYQLDGDIGSPTGVTEDSNSSDSASADSSGSSGSSSPSSSESGSSNSKEESSDSHSSGSSVAKMTSVIIPAGAAAVGAIAMLF
ncbi:hypothetical protein EV175_001384 [Coemansia sp. RSA 1933]|nr:hypothetical protein EV175_001384 [Coemansia sp. RSA 1933]